MMRAGGPSSRTLIPRRSSWPELRVDHDIGSRSPFAVIRFPAHQGDVIAHVPGPVARLGEGLEGGVKGPGWRFDAIPPPLNPPPDHRVASSSQVRAALQRPLAPPACAVPSPV